MDTSFHLNNDYLNETTLTDKSDIKVSYSEKSTVKQRSDRLQNIDYKVNDIVSAKMENIRNDPDVVAPALNAMGQAVDKTDAEKLNSYNEIVRLLKGTMFAVHDKSPEREQVSVVDKTNLNRQGSNRVDGEDRDREQRSQFKLVNQDKFEAEDRIDKFKRELSEKLKIQNEHNPLNRKLSKEQTKGNVKAMSEPCHPEFSPDLDTHNKSGNVHSSLTLKHPPPSVNNFIEGDIEDEVFHSDGNDTLERETIDNLENSEEDAENILAKELEYLEKCDISGYNPGVKSLMAHECGLAYAQKKK